MTRGERLLRDREGSLQHVSRFWQTRQVSIGWKKRFKEGMPQIHISLTKLVAEHDCQATLILGISIS